MRGLRDVASLQDVIEIGHLYERVYFVRDSHLLSASLHNVTVIILYRDCIKDVLITFRGSEIEALKVVTISA